MGDAAFSDAETGVPGAWDALPSPSRGARGRRPWRSRSSGLIRASGSISPSQAVWDCHPDSAARDMKLYQTDIIEPHLQRAYQPDGVPAV